MSVFHMSDPYEAGKVMQAGVDDMKLRERNLLVGVVVRQLHSERRFNGDGYGWSVCAECRQAWPCATEQAIRSVLDIPGRDMTTQKETNDG